MKKSAQRLLRPAHERKRVVAMGAAFSLLTFGAAALWASPASATALDDVTLTVSNNATSATPVTYTWNFSTKTAGALTSLTFSVPSTTAAPTSPATLTTSAAYGLTGCDSTTAPTLAADTVTLTLSSCSVAASTPVSIAISGFTNTTDADSGFATTVTTSAGDTGTAATGVDFNSNETQVDVIVPDSLTFINANPKIELLPVPGNVAVASPVKLTVATNAKNGYTLTSCVTSAHVIKTADTPTHVISQLASPGVLNGTTTAFGAQATFLPNTGSGTHGVGVAALQGAWVTASGSNYVGYASDCDPAGSAANAKVIANSGTTNGDEITLTNAVSVDSVHPNGSYSGVITYQVAPSY